MFLLIFQMVGEWKTNGWENVMKHSAKPSHKTQKSDFATSYACTFSPFLSPQATPLVLSNKCLVWLSIFSQLMKSLALDQPSLGRPLKGTRQPNRVLLLIHKTSKSKGSKGSNHLFSFFFLSCMHGSLNYQYQATNSSLIQYSNVPLHIQNTYHFLS